MGVVLGLSAYYHDSAAALVVDGKIVAAAQEERFSRIKGDSRFPARAIEFCLKSTGTRPEQVTAIVYYEKPWLTFERILSDLVDNVPFGYENFRRGLSVWYGEKFFLKQRLRRSLRNLLGMEVRSKLKFSEHHLSHAASAFYPSPFKSAAILTIDGVGEWATCTVGHGQEGRVRLLEEMRYPHSWGLVYAAFTHFLGFKVNSGEYKVMGLAPFADPLSADIQRFKQIILRDLITLNEDGSIDLNSAMFDFRRRGKMVDVAKWSSLFGMPAREPEAALKKEHANLAFALQSTLEEGVIRLARHTRKITGEANLVMAGGVALNCAANGRLLREKIFDEIWIQPAAGDAGGALGAALAYHHLVDQGERRPERPDSMSGSALGPSFTNQEVLAELEVFGLQARSLSEDELVAETADRLHQGQIAGWFQGRAEWGPRALCRRSILARASDPEMQKRLNVAVKFRETFRPFAPVVLNSDSPRYFVGGENSPYMLFTYPLHPDQRHALPGDFSSWEVGDKLKSDRGTLPAITHMDYSARIQTVDTGTNPRMAKLLEAYKGRSGHAVLVNTSFNRRGEPIVNSPRDAIISFLHTDIDFLVIEDFMIVRAEQAPDKWAAAKSRFHDETMLTD